MKLLIDWFTGPTNADFELGRALWAGGALAMLGFTGWHLHTNGHFDVMQFGLAYAALLAAGGFGVATKDKASHQVRSQGGQP